MTLNSLLHKCKVISGGEYTHTSLEGGSYYIGIENAHLFYELYAAEIAKGMKLSLTEKHRQLSPILIDLDFRFTENNRIVTNELIEDFIRIYTYELEKYVDTFDKEIFVFQKKNIKHKNKIYKDGIHIIIPDIVTKPIIQYKVREETLKHIEKLFDMFDNSVEDIFDKAVIEKNNWFLFGSTKPNDETYNIIDVYKNNEKIKYEYNDILTQVIKFSIRNKFKESELKCTVEEPTNDLKETKKLVKSSYNETDLNFVKDLVNILKIERSDDYNSWIRCGWCLHNISDQLLDTWIEFSKDSCKFKEGECESLWFNMRSDGLNIGSLRSWAKEDDINRYYEVLSRYYKIGSDLQKCVCTHGSIANCIYPLLKDSYVFDGNYWYYFGGQYWIKDNHNILIKKEFRFIRQQFIYALNIVLCDVENSTVDTRKSSNKEKGKDLYNIINKLEDHSFKEKVILELKENLYNPKIRDRLDSNKYLIGFTNGVYDLTKSLFRNGDPQDFISKTVGYDYSPLVNEEVNKDLADYFDSLFDNQEDKEYLLKTLSYNLSGDKYLEEFYILTGKGANAKGTTIKLIKATLGNYFAEIDIKNFTDNNRRSGSAQSEIALLEGIRFVTSSEPEESDKIQSSMIKLFSGNDSIVARQLYCEARSFEPQFAIFIQCNNIPKLSKLDEGVIRRLKIIDFNHQFVKEPKLPYQRPIKYDLKSKFENNILYRQTFMNILITYYNTYVKGKKNINIPVSVNNITQSYINDNNIVRDWLIENYEITNNSKDRIKAKELLDVFKFNTSEKISAPQFKQYLTLVGVEYKRMTNTSYYLGIKPIKSSNVVENDDM